MTTGRRRLRTVSAAVAAAVLAPLVVCAAGMTVAAREVYTPPPPEAMAAAVPPPPAHDASKPTAVIVFGRDGTNVADTLAPFEVLKESGVFNVYAVADQRVPIPLTGGLDVMPDLSFVQLDTLLGSRPPDVVVAPQLKGEAGPDGPVVRWLREQHSAGAPLIVTVCVGAELLADAGVLDGRPATAHWLKLIGLRREFPQVQWRDDVRYVDDGDVVTTAAVLSGVDGALRAIERTAGPAEAQKAAAAVRWPFYSASAPAAIIPSHLGPADLVGLLSAGFRWDRPRMGVLLRTGVGEIALASAFRPYTELSFLARPVAVSMDGGPVRSRHGLTFLPRQRLREVAPDIDRLVVPGTAMGTPVDQSLPEGLTPVYLPDRPGFPVDAALRDIASEEDVATARWVAKTLAYPLPEVDPAAARWPWSLTLRPVVLAVAAAGAVLLVGRILRRWRGARP